MRLCAWLLHFKSLWTFFVIQCTRMAKMFIPLVVPPLSLTTHLPRSCQKAQHHGYYASKIVQKWNKPPQFHKAGFSVAKEPGFAHGTAVPRKITPPTLKWRDGCRGNWASQFPFSSFRFPMSIFERLKRETVRLTCFWVSTFRNSSSQ